MSYLSTRSGRLLTLAGGFALAGCGLVVLVGHATGIAIMCASLLATIVTTIWAVAFGTDDSPYMAILTIVVGPWVFFLYALGVGVSMDHAPSVGYGLVLFGALALSRAAFGPRAARVQRLEPAHAHAQ
jgi:predicted neutral ceramidase superfamily lipid hydrolase